jgi:ubiquitin carboxyl-terminal hydrolase 5/13
MTQAGEELQPTTDEPKKETLEPDASIVAELMGMGFSENGSKRAALATRNAGSEAAMEWVFSHMEDPDFNDPIVPPGEDCVLLDTGYSLLPKC